MKLSRSSGSPCHLQRLARLLDLNHGIARMIALVMKLSGSSDADGAVQHSCVGIMELFQIGVA